MSSFESRTTIAQPSSDASLLPPGTHAASQGLPSTEALLQRVDALQEQVQHLNALLAKPLSEILGAHDKALETTAAWDAFGAMWMLSQRAMRRVALDLAAQQGMEEADVVARAMHYASEVLNGDGVDLQGSIAPAQLAHIARHRAHLRKQFRAVVAAHPQS